MKDDMGINAVIITEKDDVITTIKDLKKGEVAKYFFKKGEIRELVLKEDIPFGHKIAIHDIPAFVDVIKYGESIGKTKKNIFSGEHVHIQNLDSNRGRGDKK